jgi:hypothetical protein
MLRKLFALLLLVTGLAAIGQPANALAISANNVRAASEAAYACAPQPGQQLAPRSLRQEREEAQPKMCPKPPRIVLIVPTVMLKADRARE